MRFIAILLFFITASGVEAQWTGAQEAEFLQGCNGPCGSNSAEANLCKVRCGCMMIELKRALPDYVAADEATRRFDGPTLKIIGEAQQVCRKRYPQ